LFVITLYLDFVKGRPDNDHRDESSTRNTPWPKMNRASGTPGRTGGRGHRSGVLSPSPASHESRTRRNCVRPIRRPFPPLPARVARPRRPRPGLRLALGRLARPQKGGRLMDEEKRIPLEPIDPRLLGQRLEEARKARGATQQEAADHL